MTYQYNPQTIKELYSPEYADFSLYSYINTEYPITDGFHVLERGSLFYFINSQEAPIFIDPANFEEGDVFTIVSLVTFTGHWQGLLQFPGSQAYDDISLGGSSFNFFQTCNSATFIVKDGVLNVISSTANTSWD